MKIIFFHKNKKKSQILGHYLHQLDLTLYNVHSLDSMEDVLSQQKDIQSVLVPDWVLTDAARNTFISQCRDQCPSMPDDLSFYLISSDRKNNTEVQMLCPWRDILYLPENFFSNLPGKEKVHVDSHLLHQLQEEFSLVLPVTTPVPMIVPAESSSKFSHSFSHSDEQENIADDNNSKHSKNSKSSSNQENQNNILYQSELMAELVDKSVRVAQTDATILITGESGTGKEVIANLIQVNSKRSTSPYLRVNCAAIASSLMESELFGYEKGAFTGALQRKKGYFEAADSGTLFLDEIGEIDINVQAKLLRVLEYGEFMRVGGVDAIKTNVRIIAATNKDLLSEVQKKQFREDLYYRLRVVPLHIPPLRKRKEDIPLLFNFFMDHFNKKYQKTINQISNEAKRALINYPWPGNVRELKNCIEGLVALKIDNFIDIADLPVEIQEQGLPKISWEQNLAIQPGVAMDVYEKEIIRKNLDFVNQNRKQCAEILNISERTLYRKIKEYDLENL